MAFIPTADTTSGAETVCRPGSRGRRHLFDGSARFAVARVILMAVAAVLGLALASTSIVAPPDRLVTPDEFTTLVFRVTSSEGAEAVVRAETLEGWDVLRQPGRVALAGRVPTPVAITVRVPATAAAGSAERVRLAVETPHDRVVAEVRLAVAEVRALRLDAPDPLVLDGGAARLTVTNVGNVDVEAELALRRNGAQVDLARAFVAARQSSDLVVEPTDAGLYELVLEGGASTVQRLVRIVRYGSPTPTPMELAGSLALRGTSDRAPLQAELRLQGPLSDFVSLDTHASSRVRRSYAELRGVDPLSNGDDARSWRVRLGSTGPPPYRLTLPSLRGALVEEDEGGWGLAAAVGNDESTLGAYVAARRRFAPAPESRAVLAIGGGSGPHGPQAAVRAELEGVGLRAVTDARYRDEELDWGAGLERIDPRDGTAVRAEASVFGVFGPRPGFSIEASARAVTRDELYAGLRAALNGLDASWAVGADLGLPGIVPGRLSQQLQLGSDASRALLRHDLALDSGWQTQTAFGIVADRDARALELSGSWVRVLGPSNVLQAFGALRRDLRDGTVNGELTASADLQLDPATLRGSARWLPASNLLETTLGASWQVDPVGLALDLALDVDDAGTRFRASLEASYAFGLAVPERIVEAAGGRRLGTLELLVSSGNVPLAGIEIEVGRYRARTGADGVATLRVSPGRYDVRLDVSSLPVGYALSAVGPRATEVTVGATTPIRFDVERTAAIQGRLLEDANADGIADQPERGVEARLLLVDAESLVRVLPSDAQGRFVARGLPPGRHELRPVDLPLGSSVVGGSTVVLSLSAGEVAEPVLLVRPVTASARSFGGAMLRVRSIEPHADRVPPGASPLVTVMLSGNADTVTLRMADREIPMRAEGPGWQARLPLADGLSAGLASFTVTARNSESESRRESRLIVDPSIPLVELDALGPVAPGERLELRLRALAEVRQASATSPAMSGTAPLPLAPTDPSGGSLAATVPIAADRADAVYDVVVTGTLADGSPFEVSAPFRVLAP